MGREDRRFIRVHKDNKWGEISEIWVDRETGVNYLFHVAGYAGGMCVLLDAEGKPVITKHDQYGRLL